MFQFSCEDRENNLEIFWLNYITLQPGHVIRSGRGFIFGTNFQSPFHFSE